MRSGILVLLLLFCGVSSLAGGEDNILSPQEIGSAPEQPKESAPEQVDPLRAVELEMQLAVEQLKTTYSQKSLNFSAEKEQVNRLLKATKRMTSLVEALEQKRTRPSLLETHATAQDDATEVANNKKIYLWAPQDKYYLGHVDDNQFNLLPAFQQFEIVEFTKILTSGITTLTNVHGGIYFSTPSIDDVLVAGPAGDILDKQYAKDSLFGYYRLSGPMANEIVVAQSFTHLTTATKFNPNSLSALTASIKLQAGTGLDFNLECAKGNIFYEDYALLDGLPQVRSDGSNFIIPAAISVFWYNGADLFPIGIQLGQNYNLMNINYYPTDNFNQWFFAKLAANAGYFSYHELVAHLFDCHLVVEVGLMAAYRTLPSSHPLSALIRDHEYRTLALNKAARLQLVPSFIPNTGVPIEHSTALLTKYGNLFQWSKLNYPANLLARGINPSQHATYYMAQDSIYYWNAIKAYVKAIFTGYYKTNAAVAADHYVHDWVTEIVTAGRLRGFPSSITTIDSLAEQVTQFIFLATTQHSGINYNQDEFFSNVRSAPNILEGQLIDKSQVTLSTIKKAYPGRTNTVFLYIVVAFLSSEKGVGNVVDDNFGLYTPSLLTQSYAVAARQTFLSQLAGLTNAIASRPTSSLGFKFDILTPKEVADSIRK